MNTEQSETFRDNRGRFMRGNREARKARGVPKGEGKRARLPSAPPSATQTVRQLLKGMAGDVIQRMATEALEGNVAAASALLRYTVATPSAETSMPTELAEHLIGLHPEARIAAVNELAAAGVVPLETARMVVASARDEIEVQLLVPLRSALAALRRGVDAREALEPLLAAADRLEAIDHAD